MPRSKVIAKTVRILKPIAYWLGVVLLFWGIYLSHQWLFKIKTISCHSNLGGCDQTAQSRVELLLNKNILKFDKQKLIEDLKADNSLIEQVRTETKLPGKIGVEIIQAQPIAQVWESTLAAQPNSTLYSNQQIYPVDGNSETDLHRVIIQSDNQDFLTNQEQIADTVELINQLNADYIRVNQISIASDSARVNLPSGEQVWFGFGQISLDKIRQMQLILSQADEPIAVLDMRFEKPVVSQSQFTNSP